MWTESGVPGYGNTQVSPSLKVSVFLQRPRFVDVWQIRQTLFRYRKILFQKEFEFYTYLEGSGSMIVLRLIVVLFPFWLRLYVVQSFNGVFHQKHFHPYKKSSLSKGVLPLKSCLSNIKDSSRGFSIWKENNETKLNKTHRDVYKSRRKPRVVPKWVKEDGIGLFSVDLKSTWHVMSLTWLLEPETLVEFEWTKVHRRSNGRENH